MSVAKTLEAIPLFSRQNEEELAPISGVADGLPYAKNSVILSEETPAWC